MAKAVDDYSLAELMVRIEEIFNANPGPIEGFNAVVQYDVIDQEPSTYQHFFENGKLTIKEGASAAPNITMQLTYDNFKKFLLLKQSGTMALMTGKVKVKGEISTGFKIENILKKYKIKEPF